MCDEYICSIYVLSAVQRLTLIGPDKPEPRLNVTKRLTLRLCECSI